MFITEQSTTSFIYIYNTGDFNIVHRQSIHNILNKDIKGLQLGTRVPRFMLTSNLPKVLHISNDQNSGFILGIHPVPPSAPYTQF